MSRVHRPALLLALLLFAAQWLLAWHGVEHLHIAPDESGTEICMVCASGGHALPAPAPLHPAPAEAAGGVLPTGAAASTPARPLPPAARGPPHLS